MKKQHLLFLVCSIFTSSVFCQITDFPFNSDLNDIVNGYTPTAIGNPSIITDGNNQVLQLEGDEALILPEAMHQAIDPNQNVEIQLRFKITDTYLDSPYDATGEFGLDGRRILITNKGFTSDESGFEVYVTQMDEEYRLILALNDDDESREAVFLFNDEIQENTWTDLKLIFRVNNEKPSIAYKLNGYYHNFPLNDLDLNSFKQSLNTQQFWVGTDQNNFQGGDGYAFAETSIDYIKIFNPAFIGNSTLFTSALNTLADHVDGTNTLPLSQQQSQLTIMVDNWNDNTFTENLSDVLNYVTTYEQNEGTVFEYYTEYIDPRELSIPRALQFMLIQYMVDNLYTSSNVDEMSGVSFLDHQIIPGEVVPSAPRITGTIAIDGDYITDPGYFLNNQEFVIRPTGYYAAPGEIVTMTIPSALINQGVKIHVGAHFKDYRADYKAFHRFPTMATKFPITSTSISVANPFGGAIYFVFPDGSNFGSTTIQFENAVKSPYYSSKTGFSNSLTDYQTDLSNGYVNWVDLESDNFMATFTRPIAEISPDATEILTPLNEMVGNFNIIAGRPFNKIRSEYIIHEPQSYTQGTLPAAYPMSIVNGDLTEADPVALPASVLDPSIYMNTFDGTTMLHEFCHLHNMPTMYEEWETNVDVPSVMAFNTVFNISLDSGLYYAPGSQNLNSDQAALDWILDPRFRNNEPADFLAVSYQSRGIAKYVDVARLFSWDSLGLIHQYWYEEALNAPEPSTGSEFVSPDQYIEVASDQLGFNFAPLWELWGSIPSQSLFDQLESYPDENRIRDRILHYRSLVPSNAAEFLAVYNSITPNIEDHHKERYDIMLTYYDESVADSIYLRIDDILCRYFDINCELLPVELLAFTGKAKEKSTQLNWITLSELNNSGFEIQKSSDRENWVKLGFVRGKGTSGLKNRYLFSDLNPSLGVNYYRLKQIDYDNTYEYSNTIAVAFNGSEKDIKIFPNPVYNFLTIEGLTDHTIRIYNTKGELQGEFLSKGKIDIDFSNSPSGIYLVEVMNNVNQEIQTTRIVKS